jgi:uncharacterized protein (DUF1697 family)
VKHVALLRGVNVGSNRKLPMKELCAIFERAGCADVASYIQSGNVVFTAPAKLLAVLPERVASAVEQRFGFSPAIVLRSGRELAAAAAHQPFDTLDHVYVGFLAAMPARSALAALDPAFGAPDRYVVRGREIYFQFAAGAGRATLSTAVLEKRLAVAITLRNWNTVQKLAAMAA